VGASKVSKNEKERTQPWIREAFLAGHGAVVGKRVNNERKVDVQLAEEAAVGNKSTGARVKSKKMLFVASRGCGCEANKERESIVDHHV
jgi:uncharacterized protein YdaU (DUF1376 family)